jgi:hydroxymethylpyrimidine pyrophosphatase-like HAD family hydrolase
MLLWDDETLSLFDGGVYYNGGCTVLDLGVLGIHKAYRTINNNVIKETVMHVHKYDALNIALQLENEDHAFRFPLEPENYRHWGLSADKVLTLDDTKGLRVVKMLIFYSDLIDSTALIDKNLVDGLRKLYLRKAHKAQLYLTDNGKLVQIMARNVNKLNSIELIRMYLGLEKNELAVFGDDINDIEMLSAYENSVAMGNADNYVKSMAKHITLDNNSGGIHHAICNILQMLRA